MHQIDRATEPYSLAPVARKGRLEGGGLDRRGEKREERAGEDVVLHRGTVVKMESPETS